MRCHNCGDVLERIITDLPFKTRLDTIIIVKKLPVLQCRNCNEYLIEDSVMEKVDLVLESVDESAELEILSYSSKSG